MADHGELDSESSRESRDCQVLQVPVSSHPTPPSRFNVGHEDSRFPLLQRSLSNKHVSLSLSLPLSLSRLMSLSPSLSSSLSLTLSLALALCLSLSLSVSLSHSFFSAGRW